MPGERYEFGKQDSRLASRVQKLLSMADRELGARGLRKTVPAGSRAWPIVVALIAGAVVVFSGVLMLSAGIGGFVPAALIAAAAVIVVVVVKEKIMGLVVDAVSDVLDIDKKDIQPAPQFGSHVDVSFLNGIGKAGDKLVALLDMDRLLIDGEITESEKVAA